MISSFANIVLSSTVVILLLS